MLAASTLARIAARMLMKIGSAAETGELRLVAQRQIARQQQVGGGAQVALPEIHQREGEIVENVAGGDVGIEFDRVEQHRLAVDDRDVAQVQIAVAAAHVALLAARDEQRPDRGERFARLARQRRRSRGIEQIGPRARTRPRSDRDRSTSERVARSPSRVGARSCERWIARASLRTNSRGQAAALGDLVERRVLVEAAHMRRPFHDFAGAADRQARALARDGHDVEIDARRVFAVDLDLRLAGGAALFQRREIEERQADRAPDLVDVVAGEKDDRALGVDPLHRSGEAVCRARRSETRTPAD